MNTSGDILWESLFGYQSGFLSGFLRFHHGGLVSFGQSSVYLVDILDNKLKSIAVKGKLTDCFCSDSGEIIAAISGQAVKSNRAKTDDRTAAKVSTFIIVFSSYNTQLKFFNLFQVQNIKLR